jgi:hypothetical protein
MPGKKTSSLYPQVILALMVCIFIILSTHSLPSLVAAYTQTKHMDNIYLTRIHDGILPVDHNSILGNLANQFGSLTQQFEYTVNLDGKQVFPNDTIKQNIVTTYKSENYNISSLNYILLGFDITASNIKIHVNPSKIDQTMTRVDLPIVIARNVSVTNGSINLNYAEVNLGSVYGIYNKNTNKMTVHIPISVALRYLPHF